MGHVLIVATAALAASAFALEIPNTPTWSTGSCTDKSLTIPSWIISGLKESAGSRAFQIKNRATDSTYDVKCTSKGQCSSTGDSRVHVSISEASGDPIVTITESWTCADAAEKIPFDASGSVEIPKCAASECVSPISHLVYGTISLPVPLKPTQPSPPPGFDASSCSNVGKDQWTVTDVSYQTYAKGQCKMWYIPDVICLDNNDGTFKSKGEYLSLKIKNNAISHDVTCAFAPSVNGETSLPTPLRCVGGKFNEITLDASWSGTAPNFNLKIEELWYCLEQPAINTKPSAIVATGSVALPLKCTTTTGVTGTPDDVVNTCIDTSSAHSVEGQQVAKKQLPDFSLVTAYPVKGGCTFDSIVDPTWYMRGMFFESGAVPAGDPDNTTLNRFTCGLTGPGFADFFFYEFEPLSGQGIDTIYNCNYEFNGQPREKHWDCKFSFNPFHKILTLGKVWECRDKDNSNPLFFGGSGDFDWAKNSEYQCSTPPNMGPRCYWHGDEATLQPGVPYDVPRVEVSLENTSPLGNIKTLRVDGRWKKAT